MATKKTETPKSYRCPKCNRKHVFPAYYFAGVNTRTTHTCECGQKNVLLRFKVVG